MSRKGDSKKCCGCSTTYGNEAVTDLFISASVFMVVASIFYLAQTDFKSTPGIRIYYEIALLFAGVMYLTASLYLRSRIVAGRESETYKSILETNYSYVNKSDSDEKADPRTCFQLCMSGNVFLVVGWITLFGTLPLILYPVPFFGVPIMVTFVILIVCFIVASSPAYMSLNNGKGSVNFNEGVCCEGCGYCCGVCANKEQRKIFGSDVLIILLGFAVLSVILAVGAMVNAAVHYTSITAWFWFIASVLFSIGMFTWHHFSVVEDYSSEEDTLMTHAAQI